MGIIQSIMLFMLFWRGSPAGVVTIFCCTHMLTPTRTGRTGIVAGWARFIPRKSPLRGTILWMREEE